MTGITTTEPPMGHGKHNFSVPSFFLTLVKSRIATRIGKRLYELETCLSSSTLSSEGEQAATTRIQENGQRII